MSWTLTKKLAQRRDQEEGSELDSHEEASPEEIKRREVSWTLTKKLAQRRDQEEGGELDSHEEASPEKGSRGGR